MSTIPHFSFYLMNSMKCSCHYLVTHCVWNSVWYISFFFFSSRRRHTRLQGDWSSDVCSSDLGPGGLRGVVKQNHGLLSLDWMTVVQLPGARPLGRQGRRHKVSLHHAAAQLAQKRQLGRCFHAFRHDVQVQAVAHLHDGGDDGRVVLAIGDVGDEGAVYLELVEIGRASCRERV